MRIAKNRREIILLREYLYIPSVNTLHISRGCNVHFCESMQGYMLLELSHVDSFSFNAY
jgi:hypothetical protein